MMPNFCTNVMNHVKKQISEMVGDCIFKIILQNDLGHVSLIDSKRIVSLIFYHEKYHFQLELLSCNNGL